MVPGVAPRSLVVPVRPGLGIAVTMKMVLRGIVVTLLLLVVGACGDDDEPDAQPSDTTEATTEGEDVSTSDLEVGDCFDDPDDTEEGEDGGISYDAAEVAAIPCDQPHDNEVFLLKNTELPGKDFPGEEALEAEADKVCLAAFEAYVGKKYDESIYDYGHLTPTAETWAEGDRELVCIVYHGQLEPLTKPVKGTAE